MKQVLILILLVSCNNAFSQVPDWIKNALPVTENHLKKIEKKGDKYIEKYKTYPENSVERKVYYRVKYIDYLKRLEGIEEEINKVQDSTKPFSFPIFVSPSNYANLVSFDGERNRISIKNDTLLNIVAIIEKYSNKGTPVYSNSDSFDLVVSNDSNSMYVLENAYNKGELNDYPHFNKWRDKYFLYALNEYNKSVRIQKVKQDSLLMVKNKILENESKSKKDIKVNCITKVDDFTGEKIVRTGQFRLITVEQESIKNQAQDLWDKGVYADYESFVFSISAIKIGKSKMLDVYIKFNTDNPVQYYGIITKGAFVEFKLENNKIIKLPFIQTVTPTTDYKYNYSYYENTLLLNDANISEFGKSKVKKVRIHFSKGYQDYIVNENGDLVSKLLDCVK